MADDLDQIFVTISHAIVGLFAAPWQPLISAIISIAAIIGVFASLFAVTTVFERKGLGRIQIRYGPNLVGPFGFLQPAADGIKALIKEDVVPRPAAPAPPPPAPLAVVVPAFLVYTVLPIGRNMVLCDFDAGVLFFFAIGAATELSVFMAGWSSRNKYSLLGAMRAIAQMISYEIPLILSAVTVIMIVGSLSTTQIVAAQAGYHSIGLPNWFVFTPWGFTGFILFMIAATAETNRSPFDLPEGESEIIAGYYIEYSGFKFALFFLGEYMGMFAISGLGITLFLGGWHAPLAALEFIPSWMWFFVKLLAIIFVFIWVRGTLPRLRMDLLMNFARKFMQPLALYNIISAAVWHFMPSGYERWLAGAALVVASYILLGRGLMEGKKIEKRTYRY